MTGGPMPNPTLPNNGFWAGAEIHVKVEGLGIVRMHEWMRPSAIYQILCGPFGPDGNDRILWRGVGGIEPLFDFRALHENEQDTNPWIELREGDHLILAPRGSF